MDITESRFRQSDWQHLEGDTEMGQRATWDQCSMWVGGLVGHGEHWLVSSDILPTESHKHME